MTGRRAIVALCAVILLAPFALAAQPVTRLGAPNATLQEGFTRIAGVREQSNRRVIIVDSREQRIVRADLASGAIETLGRPGHGPGEYTLPLAVHGWRGDTTLIPDMDGRGRALVVTARGVSTARLRGAGMGATDALFSSSDFAFDSAGRMFRVRRGAEFSAAGPVRDSSAIERWDRASGKREVVARVSELGKSPLLARPPARAASGGSAERRSGGTPPFITLDQWAVAPDGRVAVVTVEPYQVTYYPMHGRPLVGPVIAYQAVRVTAADKEAWREEKRQPTIALVYGEGGTAPRTVPQTVREPDVWPEVLPPFLMHAVRFAPDGTLWVQLAVAAGKPVRFDVIDPRGGVLRQVELPPRTRLVGFGRNSVYLARSDEDDIERLERHAFP